MGNKREEVTCTQWPRVIDCRKIQHKELIIQLPQQGEKVSDLCFGFYLITLPLKLIN